MIDIGGPSLIRAASKNFKYITSIADVDDYKKLKTNSSEGIKSGLRLVLEFSVSFLFIYFIDFCSIS